MTKTTMKLKDKELNKAFVNDYFTKGWLLIQNTLDSRDPMWSHRYSNSLKKHTERNSIIFMATVRDQEKGHIEFIKVWKNKEDYLKSHGLHKGDEVSAYLRKSDILTQKNNQKIDQVKLKTFVMKVKSLKSDASIDYLGF
jgi:hypothetical protein